MDSIHELKAGTAVDRVFSIVQNDLKTARTGKHFLQLELRDKSGSIPAKKWDANPEMHEQLPAGTVIQIQGRIDEYKGNRQLVINSLSIVPENEVDPADFLPASTRDPDEMFAELRNLLAKIKQPDIKRLVDSFLEDDDFRAAFCRAPAARKLHQAYLGGLLEHTLSVLNLAEGIYSHYPDIDVDLMRAGIFLHDIGKTKELESERTLDYSSAGMLVGHLAIGCEMIREKIGDLEGFPDELLRALEHMVLSHHGRVEWGAVTTPCFAEAVLLHHLDNIDAKVSAFFEIMAEEGDTGSDWTERKYMFDNTRLWKGVHRGLIRGNGPEEKPKKRKKKDGSRRSNEGELPF
ncbi:MAG: 3'-5' exoribonuclease YhaM family protein [Planctomycetota bacterium]